VAEALSSPGSPALVSAEVSGESGRPPGCGRVGCGSCWPGAVRAARSSCGSVVMTVCGPGPGPRYQIWLDPIPGSPEDWRAFTDSVKAGRFDLA